MQTDLTVIGVGNLYMGDDGVGVRIVQQLLDDPDANADGRIEFIDGGVGGLRMINWIEQADRLLFIDAANFGGAPGETKLLGPEQVMGSARGERFSLHETGIANVLKLTADHFRAAPSWVLAIQVQAVEQSDKLSEPLADRLDALTDEVKQLALRLLNQED
jgi:hydrogenase maturation protease